jgi:hypothetical protein
LTSTSWYRHVPGVSFSRLNSNSILVIATGA